MIKENHPDNNVGNIEYIEKKKVIDALEKVAGFFPYKVPGNADTYLPYNEAWNDAIGRAEMEMESLEKDDVVPVVRCKDCKFYTSMRPDIKTGICDLNMHHMGDDGFCSCGERREE